MPTPPTLKSALALFGRTLKAKGADDAGTAMRQAAQPGLGDALLQKWPEHFGAYHRALVDEAAALDPVRVAAALTTHDGAWPGEWFPGWSEAMDLIVASAYARDRKAFASVVPATDVGKLGLLLVKRRFGDNALADVAPLHSLIFTHLGPHFSPGRVMGPKGLVTLPATKLDGREFLTPFDPLFASRAELVAALRRHAIASFAGPSPRPELVPFVLEGASPEELLALMVGGESHNEWLPFGHFIDGVHASKLTAKDFLAAAQKLAAGANGASLAAWGALLLGGGEAYPSELDDRIDLWPCHVRTVSENDALPLPDVPAMLVALGPWQRPRLRALFDRNLRQPSETAYFGRNVIAYGLLGLLGDDALVDRFLAQREQAFKDVEHAGAAARGAAASAWDVVGYAGIDVILALFTKAGPDDQAKERAFSALRTHCLAHGEVPPGTDAMLTFAIDTNAWHICDVAPLLDDTRRAPIYAYAAKETLAGNFWPQNYAGMIQDRVSPADFAPLAKKKTRAKEVMDLLLNHLGKQPARWDALDAWLPAELEKIGYQPKGRQWDDVVRVFGEARAKRWWPR